MTGAGDLEHRCWFCPAPTEATTVYGTFNVCAYHAERLSVNRTGHRGYRGAVGVRYDWRFTAAAKARRHVWVMSIEGSTS